jgi:hypothetical protein
MSMVVRGTSPKVCARSFEFAGTDICTGSIDAARDASLDDRL